mmetsp:Transcript_3227/g.14004  ORF Transcript_3227/g.14004 Transcript_3227/m.14004 type:complete len:237 (+) Transcript_3227:185-895(+)
MRLRPRLPIPRGSSENSASIGSSISSNSSSSDDDDHLLRHRPRPRRTTTRTPRRARLRWRSARRGSRTMRPLARNTPRATRRRSSPASALQPRPRPRPNPIAIAETKNTEPPTLSTRTPGVARVTRWWERASPCAPTPSAWTASATARSSSSRGSTPRRRIRRAHSCASRSSPASWITLRRRRYEPSRRWTRRARTFTGCWADGATIRTGRFRCSGGPTFCGTACGRCDRTSGSRG